MWEWIQRDREKLPMWDLSLPRVTARATFSIGPSSPHSWDQELPCPVWWARERVDDAAWAHPSWEIVHWPSLLRKRKTKNRWVQVWPEVCNHEHNLSNKGKFGNFPFSSVLSFNCPHQIAVQMENKAQTCHYLSLKFIVHDLYAPKRNSS